MKNLLGFFVLVGVFSWSYADDRSDAINALAQCTSSDNLYGLRHEHSVAIRAFAYGNDDKPIHAWDAKMAAVKSCIGQNVEPAVKAAGNHDDLKKAIKDFFVKSTAYMEVFDRNGEIPAERERDVAWSSVQLEMRLANFQ